MTAVLAARGVGKAFFGNRVLHDVSVDLIPGRIHALLGENGAGKSTLINILSGALAPDGGHVEVDGRPVAGLTPREARALGIAVVQQELSLSPHLSIAENIALGAPPRRYGLIDYRALAGRARAACAEVGVTEPLDMPVDRLPLGRRQLVEIAKALYRRPRVLVLDEPTSSLSANDVGVLMRLVRRLAAEGVAVLYISHRLNEVLDLCDHVTVLKDGARTADRSLAGIDPEGLVQLMVGRDHGGLFPAFASSATNESVLTVAGFRSGQVADVALSLRRGEVLGLGGLVGHGQEDFLLGLIGARPATAASATLLGRPRLPRSAAEAAARGLVYVPADRKTEALLLPHAIAFNLMLPSFARLPGRFRRRRAEAATVAKLAATYGIRGETWRPAQALSGGNQQKVALAKFLPLAPRIWLLNDPTRGVDVQTKREIYLALQAMARGGTSVVLLSSDTPELVHLCDRVAVFRESGIAAVLEHEQASEGRIVATAMGVAA